MMTMALILIGIGFGLNIAALVRICTNTLPMPEKCSHGHPVKENDTFEEYCKDRWQFSKTYANNLIGSSKVVSNLNDNPGCQMPVAEKHVRPMTKIPPEDQAEVDHE